MMWRLLVIRLPLDWLGKIQLETAVTAPVEESCDLVSKSVARKAGLELFEAF